MGRDRGGERTGLSGRFRRVFGGRRERAVHTEPGSAPSRPEIESVPATRYLDSVEPTAAKKVSTVMATKAARPSAARSVAKKAARAAGRSASGKKAPAKKAAVRKAPAKKVPVRNAPGR